MKNSKKLLSIIVLVSILSVGCTVRDKEPKKQETNRDIDDRTSVDKNGNESQSKVMTNFMKLIKPESKASDLGNYIRDNIKGVNQVDVEKMIEYLIIYQTEVIDDFNEKLYKTEYLQGLNKDMNGKLDSSKIKDVSNEKVKSDYQSLVDGFLTIRRYEEHPVVETDWSELSKYSSNMSKDLKDIIDIHKKVQHNDYIKEESTNNFSLDRFEVSKDIVKVEEIIKSNKSDYIDWQANKLYKLQISTLLVGPEGEYLDIWTNKDSEEYQDIIKIKDDYKDTNISTLISELDDMNIEEIMQVNDKIDENLQFGLGAGDYLETLKYNKGQNEYNVLQLNLVDEKDKEKQNRINEMIKSDVDKQIENLDIKENFTLTTFLNFENDKYISYNGFISYKDPKGDNEDLNFYRVLDYKQEKYITLEEYFDTNFDSLKNNLQKITEMKFETMPEFQLFDSGIVLYPISQKKGEEEYAHLNYKDLIPYFTLQELMHGK